MENKTQFSAVQSPKRIIILLGVGLLVLFIAITSVVIIVTSSRPTQAAHVVADFNFTTANGQVTIIGPGQVPFQTDLIVNIPATINGFPVTTISNNAFLLSRVIEVTIPDTVISIGDLAFGHNQITTLVIPNSVTYIGFASFAYNHLTSVQISDNLTSIGNSAFGVNNLTNIIIPDGVTIVEDFAFGHNQLASVQLPDSLTHIGNYAFHDNQLTSIVIPETVTYIGEGAFISNQLANVNLPDNLTHIGRLSFRHNQLTNIVIPDKITHIAAYTFEDNELTSVHIPNGVTDIEKWAFQYNQLTTITIPASVTYIAESAFAFNQFTQMPELPAQITVFQGFNNNPFITNNFVTQLPNQFTSIGNAAFISSQLTNITIPNHVTKIAEYSFTDNQLTSVVIPNNVIEIGEGVFLANPASLTIYTAHLSPGPNGWHEDWNLCVINGIIFAVVWGHSILDSTIIFDTQQGKQLPPVIDAPGTTFTLPSTTRPGFTFLGWTTSSTSTTVEYLAGDTWTIDGSQTLYAVWNGLTFTIAFHFILADTPYGVGLPLNISHVNGTTVNTLTQLPSITGRQFLGFWDAPSGGNLVFDAYGIPLNEFLEMTENITLYARFSEALVNGNNCNLVPWIVGAGSLVGLLILALLILFLSRRSKQQKN
ncbi:MAG: leucine-rich repeat protein [Firmicutes bacterium]|nr:leucine-rich repeat protein [Bacillota bacterium]